MGLLSELENIKYASAFELIKNEEAYDKTRRVVSGLEAFYLCYERYELLRNIINPLKIIFGDNMIVVGVSFNSINQNETVVTIKYVINDKLNIMVINMFDLDILEITLSDSSIDSDILEEDSSIISKIIFELDGYGFFDESEISLRSSSKKFNVIDNCSDFIIKSIDEKILSVGTNYYQYNKEKKLYLPDRITSESSKLKELLANEENVQRIYSNLRIYEDDLPKRLIKKIK